MAKNDPKIIISFIITSILISDIYQYISKVTQKSSHKFYQDSIIIPAKCQWHKEWLKAAPYRPSCSTSWLMLLHVSGSGSCGKAGTTRSGSVRRGVSRWGTGRRLLLLFVWPPVGGGFLSLPPRLHGPKGQPPKFSRRENCWEVPKSHYAGVPCVLLSVTSLRYIRISTYMLTLVTSEVPRSLSRRKPRRFLRTHSRSIFPRYWTWDVFSYGTTTRRRLYFFGWV